MRKVIWAITAGTHVSASHVATATEGPVYLTCTLDGKPDWIMDVQLNERDGTASIHYRHGGNGAIIRSAAFASDRVSFERYIVSRIDLRFTKDNRRDSFASVMNLPPIEEGQCEIDKRDRSF